MRWEEISREQPLDDHQLRFGIVQGSVYHDLRAKSAAHVASLDFDGCAIGGVSVGESQEEMFDVTSFTAPLLPSFPQSTAVGKESGITKALLSLKLGFNLQRLIIYYSVLCSSTFGDNISFLMLDTASQP